MRFGNSWKIVAQCTLFGLALGLVALAFVMILGSAEARARCLDSWYLLPALLAGIMFVAVTPTALLSVQVTDGKIRHVFLNRFVLSEADTADYEGLKSGPVLRFKQGKAILLYGMRQTELRRLDQYLAELSGKGQASSKGV